MEKNKIIKVKFLRGNHPQFDEIEDFPPKGVEYEVTKQSGLYHGFFSQLKRNIYVNLCRLLKIPRITNVKTDCDLIYSTRGFLVNGNKPWIIDLENAAIFCSLDWGQLQSQRIQKTIQKYLTSNKCKKILPQSEASKRTLLDSIDCRGFEDKIEVVYLAMRKCSKKLIKHDKFTISFVGYNFYHKGGHDLIEAFKKLREKYDIEMIMKSIVPKEYGDIEGIKYYNYISDNFNKDELFEKIYLRSDAYVMPTYIDHYGLVYLDAMSAGLPIITTDEFTSPELIDSNGFVIHTDYCWENYVKAGDLQLKQFAKDKTKLHPEIIKELIKDISILIEDKKLRLKMGKNSKKLIDKGKLSIEERNKKLKRIYEESI